MTVRVYKSTDTGAPTLSGTSGDLTTVLDAVLVNGYNTNNPPGAGWSLPSLGGTNPGSNVHVYRQGARTDGLYQYYMRVNDSGARVGTRDEAVGSANRQEARIRGYEIMDTLTDPAVPHHIFPTVVQRASGFFVRKSTTGDNTARAWIALADARTIMMFVATGDNSGRYYGWHYGDYFSFRTSDVGGCLIGGRTPESSSTFSTNEDDLNVLNHIAGANTMSVTNRDENATADTPNNIMKVGDGGLNGATNTNMAWVGTVKYGNPVDNRFYMAPIRVCQNTVDNVIRGRLRGLWHGCHPLSAVSDGDTFSGAGDLAGKTFQIIRTTPDGTGYWVVETSNTWESN